MHNHFTARKRRANDLSDMLRTVGRVEQRFGFGIDRNVGVQKQVTNVLPDSGATRFAGAANGVAAALKPCLQGLGLGRFTGPVATFKGDEETGSRCWH